MVIKVKGKPFIFVQYYNNIYNRRIYKYEENKEKIENEVKEEIIKKNQNIKDSVYKIPNTFAKLLFYVYVVSIISVIAGVILIRKIIKEQY